MKGEERRPAPPFYHIPPVEGQIIIIDDFVRPLPYFGGKTMKRLRRQIAESLTLPSSFWITDTTSLLDIFSGEDK